MMNHRGHAFDLQPAGIRTIHKIVAYLPHELLPRDCHGLKHHESQTAGTIHVFAARDYLDVIQTLLTPAEVSDYLLFREALIRKWGVELASLPEQALVGQFLSGDFDHVPANDFVKYTRMLNTETDDWDLSTVIRLFADRTTKGDGDKDYYHILREIAQLNRNELRSMKERLRLSMNQSRANEFVAPYRMAVPRTDCGFVFIPVTQEMLPNRHDGVKNLTLAHKYDQRLPKCIGVSVAPEEESGWFSFEWCYIEGPWIHAPELDEMLRKSNPFREVTAKKVDRYRFH